MIVIKPGKLRDCMMLSVLFLGLGLQKFAEICTGKPNLTNYIKRRLKFILDSKIVVKDYKKHLIAILLQPKNIDKKDKINISKSFGIPESSIQIFMKSYNLQAVVFSPRAQKIILANIQKYPKTEPEIFTILSLEQKQDFLRRQKRFFDILHDVFEYLMYVPIVGYLLRQLIWHRDIFRKIFKYFPEDSTNIRIIPYLLMGLLVLLIFMSTVIFWLTLFFLLLAGYGIRKIREDVKIKFVT